MSTFGSTEKLVLARLVPIADGSLDKEHFFCVFFTHEQVFEGPLATLVSMERFRTTMTETLCHSGLLLLTF